MTMRVAVAIVGFRNVADIERCLTALNRCTYRDFVVVICENGGADACVALARTLPAALAGGQSIQLIEAPNNLGYAGGVNVCLRAAADADAWWILNPDTEPAPDALGHLVARFQQGDCAAVGGRLLNREGIIQTDGGRWWKWIGRAAAINHGRHVDELIDEAMVKRQLGFISGASMLVGRAIIEQVGMMREDYFLYAEEVEWCQRALRSGMTLGFAPRACVIHDQGMTTGSGIHHRQRPRLPVYLDERNRILVTRDAFPIGLPVAAAASLIQIILRFGRRGAWHQIGYALAGWRDGLLNRRGAPSWLDKKSGIA